MQQLKMKIVGFDENTHSILVSFASDTAQKTIDEYRVIAFQVKPGVDPEEILKSIAKSGVQIAERQNEEELPAPPASAFDAYRNLVGQELQYDVAQLAQPHTVSE